jgi:hypothetical protein
MKNRSFYKAQRFCEAVDEVESATIVFDTPFPGKVNTREADNIFIFDAGKIEELLYEVLPGGTYDRLLGEMLSRKSTHYIVSHAG